VVFAENEDFQDFGHLRVLLSEDVSGGTTADVSMSTSVDLEIGTNPSDVQCGELDGMNGPDIVISDNISDGRVFVVYNDGAGTFRDGMGEYQREEFALPGGTSNDLNDHPAALCLGDFDQDGWLDIQGDCAKIGKMRYLGDVDSCDAPCCVAVRGSSRSRGASCPGMFPRHPTRPTTSAGRATSVNRAAAVHQNRR
jgi:hypothetical protein